MDANPNNRVTHDLSIFHGSRSIDAPRKAIVPIIKFESVKRYPQNVSINSNFTVDESLEARNREVSRNRLFFIEADGRAVECDAFIMAALLPRKLEANIYRSQVALAPLAKAGKEAEGWASEPKRFTRGRRRIEGSNEEKGWHSYFASDKANNRFPGILRRCRIVRHCGPPQKEGMRENEEENESEPNRRISSVPRVVRRSLRSTPSLRKVLA